MTHKLVITQAHFQCGPLIAPTEITFTTDQGGEVAWKGMIRRYVDDPVEVVVPNDGALFIEHCPMSSVSICNAERVLMRTSRHAFPEVKLSVKATAPCGKCGRQCSRTKKFWQTLNPFNKNDDGSVKTRDEIMSELGQQAAQYRTQTIYHAKCED